jgi:hypothetical protein
MLAYTNFGSVNSMKLSAILFLASIAAATQAQILINFDDLPGGNQDAGSFISSASRLSDQYLSLYGVRFSSGGGYVGVVALSGSFISAPNGISGSTSNNLVTYGRANPITASFWMPGNETVAAGTNFVSLRGDTDTTNGGWDVTLNAYDIDGNLVATDTQVDLGGETLTVTSSTSNIHSIVFLGSPGDNGGVAVDNFEFNEVSAVPEPGSLIALGIGAIAAMRRRRRR